jgi:hypothetical protein
MSSTTSVTLRLDPRHSLAQSEVDWFFAVADGELGLRSSYIDMLVPGRHRVDPLRDPDRVVAAARAWRVIHGRLRAIQTEQASHAGVLQAAHTVRAWPRELRARFGILTGIVVRLVAAEEGLPVSHDELERPERQVAERLASPFAAWKAGAFPDLRKRAAGRYGRALDAYVLVRGGAGCAMEGTR